jgi:hypothetical protein
MSKENLMTDGIKYCPFHEKSMTNPENAAQAFCDQLHSDVLVLYCLTGAKDVKGMHQQMEIIETHVQNLRDVMKRTKIFGDKK